MRSKTSVKAGSHGASPFSRSLRSLEADSFRKSGVALLLAGLLLGAWLAWFFLAQVARYEVTDEARLEVDQAIYPVQAHVSGRVVASRLALGREVQSGEVLVELETDPQQLQLKEEQARLAALPPQIAALRQEMDTAAQAQQQELEATGVASEQAGAQYREAEALAEFAEQEAERLARLQEQGLISERDFLQGKTEAQRRRAAAQSLQLSVRRLEPEQKTRERDRETRLNRVQSEIVPLEKQLATAAASINRIKYDIERRSIRAPIAGKLGEVQTLRIGGYVGEGDKLGAVVPHGKLRIVAEYTPPAALGRIQPGQPARLRLHGFPWTQYGSIRGTVVDVASEIRDGHVRVELKVDSDPTSPIPLQHGLPGSVEVEVERISPATLVLRTAGRWVASPRSIFEARERGDSSEGQTTR